MSASRAALATAVAALLVAGSGAPAASAKARKPSLKIAGLSVNRVYMTPGTKVPYPDSANRCYMIGGASGAPDSLTVYGFVQAVKIPASAPTTVTFTAPWSAKVGAGLGTTTGPFSKVLFRSKGRQQASLYGGAQGPFDFYSYTMLPTGYPTSYYLSGAYTLDVRTTVNGKALHAKGTATLNCP